MKRYLVIGLYACLGSMMAMGQEQDTLQAADKMQALQEVVIKGNLPHTRIKGNAMVTRIQGTPLAESGSLGEMLVKVPGMSGSEESPEGAFLSV